MVNRCVYVGHQRCSVNCILHCLSYNGKSLRYLHGLIVLKYRTTKHSIQILAVWYMTTCTIIQEVYRMTPEIFERFVLA